VGAEGESMSYYVAMELAACLIKRASREGGNLVVPAAAEFPPPQSEPSLTVRGALAAVAACVYSEVAMTTGWPNTTRLVYQ